MHTFIHRYPLPLLPLALRDNRIQLHRSTPTELSITIGDVQLSDEGEYTCSIFTMPVRTARATITVLGGSHGHATPYVSNNRFQMHRPVNAAAEVDVDLIIFQVKLWSVSRVSLGECPSWRLFSHRDVTFITFLFFHLSRQ